MIKSFVFVFNHFVYNNIFFKVEKEDKSNLSELIEKYLLEEKYRIHFVRHKDIQKYSLIASKKRDEQELKNIELEKESLEINLNKSIKNYDEYINKKLIIDGENKSLKKIS